MITRPKSALYLSFPYNFSSKEEAIQAKRKFKQTIHESVDQAITKRSATTLGSIIKSTPRSYKDSGPSLFHQVKKTYSHANKMTLYNRNSNVKKLKPCKKISRISLQNMKNSLKIISQETALINSILMNTEDINKKQKKTHVWFKKQVNKISAINKHNNKQNRFFNILRQKTTPSNCQMKTPNDLNLSINISKVCP